MVLDLDGVRILTDPLLRPHVGALRRLTAPPAQETWRDPDVVLLSHLHHDHADLKSLRMVSGLPIASSPANAAWLRHRGLAGALPLGEDWTPVGYGVEIRQVRADHRHRLMPHRPNDAHGHLVRGASAAVWVAGDTALHPEMAELAGLAGRRIDLALVPVWGWGPRLSPGHLTPEDAARAVAMTGARYAIPVHWGTLHPPFVHRLARAWLERPGDRFASAVAKHVPGATAIVLSPGASWAMPDAVGRRGPATRP